MAESSGAGVSQGLPRWVSVVPTAHLFTPCCDLCGWIGDMKPTLGSARNAARSHARSRLHREDSEAVARASR